MENRNQFDVIIIGGGITGAGTARDCALRGLSVLLIERNDIADGATGRNHGLLHSGARYAVKDGESARECIVENRILRKIAPHCIEENGGIFITLPEDEDAGYGEDYRKLFIRSCIEAGIDAKEITPKDALRMEPSVNPALTAAVCVPDGSVDPFRLCSSNILDAIFHGAEILTYTELLSFIKEGDRICGITVRSKTDGSIRTYHSQVVINAAGIWGQHVAELAGARISMYPAKGSLLVFAHRVNDIVINRCRKSADGDILVPGETVTVIGTTSTRIPLDRCDGVEADRDEVRILLEEGSKLCPALAYTRILRAYAGVRPLVASDDDPTGRSISRGIVCLDHSSRDGIDGLITITGGKLMTYRLMAEKATDLTCRKIGRSIPCMTAVTPLPSTVSQLSPSEKNDRKLLCECESITRGEIKAAIRTFRINSLQDLRRRTRIGMGSCQGTFCIQKAARLLAETKGKPEDAERMAVDYLKERWKGMTAVAWGDTLREMEFMQRVFKKGAPSTFKD